jgi:hypothetical protein
MAQIKKQTPIKVRIDTGDQIRFLSKTSGLSITETLSEIIGSVFQISCTFSNLNLEYEYDISKAQVLITAKGKNNLQNGSFEIPSSTSDKVVDRMIESKISKVKKND